MAELGHHFLLTRPGMVTEPNRYSMAALAYLGDSIYELFIRSLFLSPPRRIRDYHHSVVEQVKAESQAKYLEKILEFLTPAELNILRQGRNAATAGPKRVSAQIYQQASSLEALLGFLYITQPERLAEVLTRLQAEIVLPEIAPSAAPSPK